MAGSSTLENRRFSEMFIPTSSTIGAPLGRLGELEEAELGVGGRFR